MRPFLTLHELDARQDMSPHDLYPLLAEEVERGAVVVTRGRYRLSAEFDRTYGCLLRSLA